MEHRRRWAVGAVAAASAVFVLVWFQPQKLWIDERVDEAAPPAAATLAGGSFVSLDHGTTGRVRILERADGRRVLRLEDLETSNGPDLYVYLSPNPVDGAEGAFDDGVLDLGRLEGNVGDQNHAVPDGADLSRYRSVVIWCDRFDSAFGAAPLEL